MQVHRKLRHEAEQSGEFGEWIEWMRHFTTHSHTSNLQGCTRSRLHVHCESDNKSESTETRKQAKQARAARTLNRGLKLEEAVWLA